MSRFDRQSQLNQLENVIEKKKREIQAKIEAQKKKETEEALIKIQKASEAPLRHPFWKRGGNSREQKEKEPPPPSVQNVFSNDGSFLDQFRKLSKTGLKPTTVDVETLAKARDAEEKEKERRKIVDEEKTQRQIERNMRERERELRKMERDRDDERWHSRSDPNEWSPKRAPLDSNLKVDLPPPGVVQLIPQGQTVQLLTPVMLTPLQQVVLNPPPAPAPIPQFTTNEIQMQAAGLSVPPPTSLPPPLPLMPPMPLPNLMTCPPMSLPPPPNFQPSSIPPPLPMMPHSIPPPSPLQVDMIPPPPLQVGMIPPPPLPLGDTKRRKFTSGPEDDIPLPMSIPLPEQAFHHLHQPPPPSSQDLGIRHLAKMVASRGDSAEDVLRVANSDDPSFRFLFDQNCAQYREFRSYIEKYRNGTMCDSEHETDSEDDSCGARTRVKRKRKWKRDDKYDPTEDGSDDSDDSYERKTVKKEEKYDPTKCTTDSEDEKPQIKKEFEDQSLPAIKFEIGSIPPPKSEVIKTEDSFWDRPSFSMFKSESGLPSFSGKNEGIPFVKEEGTTVVKEEGSGNCFQSGQDDDRARKRRSRWGEKAFDCSGPPPAIVPLVSPAPVTTPLLANLQLPPGIAPAPSVGQGQVMLHQVTRKDPGLVAYARQTFGSINLSDEDWKRAEDHYKVNLLYHDMMKKKEELNKLARAGKFKYEYDSDEDTHGGTWEHKLRNQEMSATQLWADELTRQAEGKHHIGDFLPPDELKRFMEKYNAAKAGREPDLSDYKEFKLREDNVGYQLLQKMGWSEGQGLGQDSQGIVDPVNKASTRMENQGLGLERPDGVSAEDDEYDAYRKRMMLAYRFRPNPLNNPRRPYY